MATAWTDLQQYVNDQGTASEAFITECLTTATALVTTYVGSATVPEAVLKSATLEVGSKLYQRRNAPNGTYDDPALGSSPLVARDPMITAYPMLNRYLVAGI